MSGIWIDFGRQDSAPVLCWKINRGTPSSMFSAVTLLALLGMVSEGEALHFLHLPATASIAENSPSGTLVHQFAVNLSVSRSPVMPRFPMIINSSPLTEAFKVNALSGTNFEVVTTGKEQLDFETGPNIFDLQIYVKDDVQVTDLQVLTVQVTDVNEPPWFLGNLAKGLNLYITEGTSPGFIYQLEAFDPEDTSRNIPLSYFLVSPVNNFNVSADGTLFSTTTFDFEVGPNSYHLPAEVRDSQGLRASADIQVTIVNINDERPRFTSLKRVYMIPEELSVGTIVANITAEDPDDTGFAHFLLYSITTVNSYFRINPLTGTIQVAGRLDRDTGGLRHNPTISLEVLVKDRPSGGQENRMQVSFIVEDINDHPAACSQYSFSMLVPENTAQGTLLLDLHKFCSDEDCEVPNNQFNFTSPSGAGSSVRFSQDPAGSGKIVLTGDLDYENASNLAAGNQYTVIVQVQDIAPPYYKNNIYIYIITSPENEFPLVFESPTYLFEVSELNPARTQVGRVRAVDKDFPQSPVLYSIVTGGADLQYPNVFWINPRTGELQLVTPLDYETIPVYVLRIQATNGQDTSLVTVTVNVLEKNDEKPICIPQTSFLTIPVDLKVGTNIQNFKLTCTDLDSSPRSFRYSIGPGNINRHFTFSPNAGSNVSHLLLATRFDYTGGLDKIWDYKLLVYITDDNLLTGRKKAQALIETGTVTLSIRVTPHPTTIVTTTPRPRITYQILQENVYSSSAWYVPFTITLGSMLLLGLLGFLTVLLAKAIHKRCKTRKHSKTLVKKGVIKNTKREVVVETIRMNTIFDGEAIDPVTGAQYEFNSQTGARRWKEPSSQMPGWKEFNPRDLPQAEPTLEGRMGRSGADTGREIR